METVLVLLMMTVGLSHGIQTHCDARQNGAQCYAALNGTVHLRLVEKFETELEYSWKHNTVEVFKIKKNTPYGNPYQSYKLRSSFNYSSGIFKMSDITRSDEAHYVLIIFKDGTAIETNLHLSVQAPVSPPPPKLSSECLSQGQMRVSCSCEGDSVQYNWTLEGQTLTDKQLLYGHHDTQNITLTVGSSGFLVCDVSNNVSTDLANLDISPCPGFKFINCTSNGTHISGWVLDTNTSCPTPTTPQPTTPPTTTTTTTTTTTKTTTEYLPLIAGSLAALLLLLLVGVGIYCKKKKKSSTDVTKQDTGDQDVTYADVRILQKQNAAGGGGAGGGGEDDVTYADVSFQKKKSRKDVRRAEREVEYGQVMMKDMKTADSVEYGEVKVSGGQRPAQSAADLTTEEDCLYAKVKVKQ